MSRRAGSMTASRPTVRRAGFHQGQRARVRPDVRRAQKRVAAAGVDRRRQRKSDAGRASAGRQRGDGLSAPARRIHPGAQPAHRQEGLAAPARAGGDRLSARNLALRGPAPAHPRHRAQPPGPRRRGAGVDRLQVAVPRSQSRRDHLSGRAAPRAARRARRGMGCRWTRSPGWPRSPASPRSASRRGRGAPRGCANGRATTWSSSTAQPSAQQLAAAQKATRPAKPESTSWAELKAEWRADARGLQLDRAAHLEARTARRAAAQRAAAHAAGAHGRADRQGRVHPRGPGGAGGRAAAGGRARGSARAHRADRRHGRCARQRAAGTRITAKDTSCSPWTR